MFGWLELLPLGCTLKALSCWDFVLGSELSVCVGSLSWIYGYRMLQIQTVWDMTVGDQQLTWVQTNTTLGWPLGHLSCSLMSPKRILFANIFPPQT